MARQTRAATLAFVVLLAACDEEGSMQMPSAPPGPPTFSGDIQPIFDDSCAFNGCHGGSILEPPGKPMSLAAGQARQNTVNVESLERPGMDRIEPGVPDSSYLVHKIQGTQLQVGGSGQRMPLNLPPLSPAQIAVIREWIQDGAKDN